MPNWCENELEVSARTSRELDIFFERYGLKEGDECGFDFDKIIPEPRTIEECPKDCIVDEHSHIEEDEDRPWFDWYKWRNKYWDVKWNASNVSIEKRKTSATIYFSTPWCEPLAIINALKQQNPNLKFRNWSEVEGF